MSKWQEVPLRTIYQRVEVRGRPDLPLLSVYRDHGVVPRDERDDNNNRPSEDLSTYKHVRPGDLVVNKMKTWQGSLAVSGHEGIVSPAYFVGRRIADVDNRFMHHLLRSSPLIAEYGARSKGIRPSQWDLPWDEFASIKVALPTTTDQRTIADYLDTETTRIDALIEKKKRMIELLFDRRRMLVMAAVTGSSMGAGIPNPRSVRHRGWWSGQVTDGWRIGRLKDLVEVDNGYPFDSTRFNDVAGTPVIRIRDLLRGYTETFFDGPIPSAALVHDGDLLIGMDGDFNSVVWSGGRAALNQRLCRLRAKPELDQQFLRYLVDLPLRYINDLTYATTVKHLSSSDLLQEKIPLPPLSIQYEIGVSIAIQTARIDKLIDALRRQLKRFLDRRHALITFAVTGELEIPEMAA